MTNANPRGTAVSANALEHGRNFLASLFMAARTAQIHDPSNQAFEKAVQALAEAAQSLVLATGGFSLRFVEDSVFLNGTALRLEGGTYSSIQMLRDMLTKQGLGGLELKRSPGTTALRKLVSLFAPSTADSSPASIQELLGEIGVLGIQRFKDQPARVQIDRRVMVVQSYGKLLLALRERLERLQQRARAGHGTSLGPPRLKPVRFVQDLVELCEDRPDFLVRLSTNRQGAPLTELLGANVSLLSIVMGHTLRIPRQDLVDIGLAALFIPLGFAVDQPAADSSSLYPSAAVVGILSDSGMSASTFLRTIVVGEQSGLRAVDVGAPPHPYAQLVRCAYAYQELVLGLAGGPPLHPLAALARLHNDRGLDLDRRWVDLLINVLRAFPKGSVVLLDDGTPAEVLSQVGGTRWDRPMVRVSGPPVRTVDLMIREEGRFLHRIQGTAFYLGRAQEPSERMEEESPTTEVTFDDVPVSSVLTDDDILELKASVDEPDAGLMQVPLLGEGDFGDAIGSDTDVSLYAPPELPTDAVLEFTYQPDVEQNESGTTDGRISETISIMYGNEDAPPTDDPTQFTPHVVVDELPADPPLGGQPTLTAEVEVVGATSEMSDEDAALAALAAYEAELDGMTGDEDEDDLDATQADTFDRHKTQESYSPVQWKK